MKTQKPLREMLPEIQQHILNYKPYMQYNHRLLLVHEGQLRKEIEDSLQKELSPTAFERAKRRIPSINVLTRIVDKLSRVYTDPAQRTTKDKTDLELLRYYEDALDMVNAMASCNRMLNLHKACALEPYFCEGKPCLRVLPASRFVVFSDSPDDPLTPTVFIKHMARERRIPYTDKDGTKTDRQEPYYVQVYHVFSDDETLVIDMLDEHVDGVEANAVWVNEAAMERFGIDGTNPIGVIPMVYVKRSEYFLTPLPDTDTLDNTVLIPKLLSDLNYAVQFQSHSIVVATDLTIPADVPWNPDVLLNLKTDEEAKQSGHVTTIKPTVDVEKVLLLIETTLALWLEARNIKTTSVVGKVTAESASSGIAKIIDEADATQDRRAQMVIFKNVEAQLWKLVAAMHAYWTTMSGYDTAAMPQAQFSQDFSVGVKFANMQPMQSEQDELALVDKQLQMGLINKRMAVMRINPHMGPDEIDALLKETGDTDFSLSGTQLKGLLELVVAVSAGELPRDTGIQMICHAFSVLPPVAEQIMASAGLDPDTGKQFVIGKPNGTNPIPPPTVPSIEPAQGGPAAGGSNSQ